MCAQLTTQIVMLATSRKTQEKPLFTTDVIVDVKLIALKQLEPHFVLKQLGAA